MQTRALSPAASPERVAGVARGGRVLPAIVALLLVVLGGTAVYVLSRPASPESPTLPPAPPPVVPEPPPALSPSPLPATTLFSGWDNPTAVLVLTGEQYGYLEPCGCTAGQTGGLTRRADLVRLLREDKGWEAVGLDLGGALRNDRAKRPQELLKLETTRAALRRMQYDVQGLGAEELRLGASELYTLFSQELGQDTTAPEFVCANVTLFEERSEDYALEIPRQFRVLAAGGLKIGVTAVVGRDTWMRVFPEGLSVHETLFGFEDPAHALERVVPLLKAEQPDVLVLLSHAGLDESRELAERFPDFRLVVTARGPEDGRREPARVGETWLLEVGQKGKTAGVVGLFADAAGPQLRFELVELNGRQFGHAPQIQELMVEYVQRLDASHPALQEEAGPHPAGAGFVGADACAECHQEAYDIWKASKHAHGYESLITGRPDEEDDEIYIVRTRDPECLSCHVTGWDPQKVTRFEGGFVDMETTPHLAGNQCENCHGPASRHVALEREWVESDAEETEEMLRVRQQLHLEVDVARGNLCIQCHDIDNSPAFDTDAKPFDTFWWPEIAH